MLSFGALRERLSRHEKDAGGSSAYLLFMLWISVLALLILGSQVALDLTPSTRVILDYADGALCALFFFDFCLSLWRAENRSRYFFRWGWLDLLSSIPTIDAFRSARLARVFRILRVLRAIRAARILTEFVLLHRAKNALMAIGFIALLLVVFSSIGMLHFETAPEANIRTPEDAMWWAVETITTVGYGDRYPITSEGRVLAALLMICGVGLIGIFTGYVAYWFMRPSDSTREELVLAIRAEIARVHDDEVRTLREEVQVLRHERESLNRGV